MEDEAYPLSIGVILGGPTATDAPWREALRRLMNDVVAAREGISSPLNVNVVFQVPGSILTPDFEGARTGAFSRARSELMVQVALPLEVLGNPDVYARGALEAAIGEVEKWNARPTRRFDLGAIREVLARLEDIRRVQ